MLQSTAADLRATLAGIETLGGRLGVTVLVVALAAALGWALLPRLVDDAEGSSLQWAVSGTVVRVLQVGLLSGAALSLAFVWGLGPYVDDLAAYLEAQQASFVGRVVASVALAVLASVSARVLADAVENLGRQAEWMTDHQEEIVLRVSQLALFATALLVVLGIWDIQLGNLLVGAGFLGIVVGLAARQTLGSLIAGFVLMFARPFTIGDWVRIGGQEGIVTDITIFNTRLENFDGEFIIIPNDEVSNQAITNRSQKGMLRISVDIGVDYETDPDHAREVALEAMDEVTHVVTSPGPQAIPKAFGDSAVVLELRFWIDHPTPPRKWKAVSAVVRSVKSAFEAEDIKIPYPQRELSGRAETGGFRVNEETTETGAPEPREQD